MPLRYRDPETGRFLSRRSAAHRSEVITERWTNYGIVDRVPYYVPKENLLPSAQLEPDVRYRDDSGRFRSAAWARENPDRVTTEVRTPFGELMGKLPGFLDRDGFAVVSGWYAGRTEPRVARRLDPEDLPLYEAGVLQVSNILPEGPIPSWEIDPEILDWWDEYLFEPEIDLDEPWTAYEQK